MISPLAAALFISCLMIHISKFYRGSLLLITTHRERGPNDISGAILEARYMSCQGAASLKLALRLPR